MAYLDNVAVKAATIDAFKFYGLPLLGKYR